VLQNEFDKLSEDSGEAAIKASDFTNIMEHFSTYFGLKVSHMIFVATEQKYIC
jgi:hypothetical protein